MEVRCLGIGEFYRMTIFTEASELRAMARITEGLTLQPSEGDGPPESIPTTFAGGFYMRALLWVTVLLLWAGILIQQFS